MIKVGVIGVGTVAQLMHLPILEDLADKFKVVAITDVSRSQMDYVAKKYNIESTYDSAEELIEQADIDAVFVLSPDPYHGKQVAHALKHGKHVFVEKPATLCSQELEGLIKLHKEHPNQIAMVGYMRRYAAPFLKAKEILEKDPRKVEYLRFRDIILEGRYFINQTRPTSKPTDVPQHLIDENNQMRREQVSLAIGEDATDAQRLSHRMLTGLGCHTFSAVRELFGLPKKIRSVVTHSGGEHMVIVMEYDGFLGVYEVVNNQSVVQFDAAIEIFQGNRKLKIKYDTPYIRYLPSTLEVIESTPDDSITTNYGPDYSDPFRTELIDFYNCIKEKRQPKTNLEDALEDLKLFEDIIAVLRQEDAK